jgi:hypothetical protein
MLALLPATSCIRKKETSPPPSKAAAAHDLTGEWQSDIQSTDRLITRSVYRIEQRGDSVLLELASTKSPQGDELVPQGMWIRGAGVWRNNAVHFDMSMWVNGRDTCLFQLRGDVDTEGRLLLHFPADLCGEKSLPYTRTLYRPGQEPAR